MEKTNRVLSILGAIVGGLIGSIPWVLMYVYGGMILAILAILIAFGALKGYQLAKGPIDKSVPWVVGIVTILMVVLSTLLIIPCLLLAKEGLTVSVTNLTTLYNYDAFFRALMGDLAISIVFAVLGISGIFVNLKKQIENGEEINLNTNNRFIPQEKIDTLKKAFTKFNAFDKNSAVTKEEIQVNFNEEGFDLVFNNLRSQQIIKKYQGKYYFSEKAQNSFVYRFTAIYAKILLVIIVLAIFVALIAS